MGWLKSFRYEFQKRFFFYDFFKNYEVFTGNSFYSYIFVLKV